MSKKLEHCTTELINGSQGMNIVLWPENVMMVLKDTSMTIANYCAIYTITLTMEDLVQL